MNTDFSQPQRQSRIGIFFIFLKTLYTIFRVLWVLAAYFLLKNDFSSQIVPIGIGLAILAVLVLVYSIFYYRNFKFHIDYEKEEFILKKGVFSTQIIAIPFDKIQQVYFKRSLLQRVIDVYNVVVDTAGSSLEEIDIKALSKQKADRLQEILMQAVEENSVPATDSSSEESPGNIEASDKKEPSWTHHLSVTDLFKIGVTTNYLRGIWLLILFFGTVQNELNSINVKHSYTGNVTGYLDQYQNPVEIILILFLLFLILLAISVFINCVEVFIKYYGLKLTQTKSSLELEMGLKTNTKISLKPRRVQMLRLDTNPIQKKLDLYQAQIFVASSEDQLKKSKIKIPGLSNQTFEKIESFLYEGKFENLRKYKPHRLFLIRRLMFSCLPLLISIPLWILLFPNPMVLTVIGPIYLLAIFLWQIYYVKTVSFEINEDFLLKKHGLWNKRVEVVELYKLQAISHRQPFWYKNRGIFNLTLHTAGGDLQLSILPKEMQREINFLLFKIESSKKAWM